MPTWWELSVDELNGLILVNLSWYHHFNICRYDQVHKVLKDEHKNLAIVNDTMILKLVAKTGNFIPTPSANQIVFNVRQSSAFEYTRVLLKQCTGTLLHREQKKLSPLAWYTGGLEFFIILMLCLNSNAIFSSVRLITHGERIKVVSQLEAQRWQSSNQKL